MWYWHEDSHICQWNIIESPEINAHVYNQLIFNKIAKTIQWGKKSFQHMVLGQLDIHMQKNKVGPPSHINSKCTKDPNARPETIRLLEKEIGVNLCDLGLGHSF